MFDIEDRLILVDLLDHELGVATKEESHNRPLLHRAFSIFLYDGDRILLQQRALNKYHSGGLWTNSCCSHPRAGESLPYAVTRRLWQELGVADCHTEEIGSFVYYNKFADNLYEYEYDHIFVGQYYGPVVANTDEIQSIRWIQISELKEWLLHEPELFTVWFHSATPLVLDWLARRLDKF